MKWRFWKCAQIEQTPCSYSHSTFLYSKNLILLNFFFNFVSSSTRVSMTRCLVCLWWVSQRCRLCCTTVSISKTWRSLPPNVTVADTPSCFSLRLLVAAAPLCRRALLLVTSLPHLRAMTLLYLLLMLLLFYNITIIVLCFIWVYILF